jgi:predicted nucleic acid-binding protein
VKWLLDSNVLLRLADSSCAENATAVRAIKFLIQSGEGLSLCPQALIEFWAVATRPRPVNGLGWLPSETAAHIRGLRAQFEFIDDGPGVFELWWELVTMGGASEKRVHDLRFLAFATARQLDAILTFNLDDFPQPAPVQVIHPAAVLS